MSNSERGWSLDLDGVFFPQQVRGQGDAVLHKLIHGLSIYDKNLEIPVIDRQISDKNLSVKEAVLLWFHGRRNIIERAVVEINKKRGDKYGNTGRLYKTPWVEMTNRQLDGHINNLVDIFFTPEGIKSTISKGAAIIELLDKKQYKRVTHIDDNPLTIFLLAKYFRDIPEVNFVLVRDESSDFLLAGINMDDYSNVQVVSDLSEITDK